MSNYKDKYDYVHKFHDGFSSVRLNGKKGFLNKNGEELCPIIYNWIMGFKNGFAVVKLNGKYGWINIHGEEIIMGISYDKMKKCHFNLTDYPNYKKYLFENLIDKLI